MTGLTIAPNLLDDLASDHGKLERKLSPGAINSVDTINVDEKTFRWMMNEDAMATEKLAEGIRAFSKDLVSLGHLRKKHWLNSVSINCSLVAEFLGL